MPDWERLVADRLASSSLPPDVHREIVVEIAAHLEECSQELIQAGSPNPEEQTLAQVPDWDALGRSIRRSKEDRMSFARRVVMPGLAAVIAALAALKLFVFLLIAPTACGADATCIAVSADGPAYLPWLATLPLAGALAAALARRMGTQPVQRFVAALAPAIYLGVETLVMSVVDNFYWRIPIYWVIVPAIACAIGAIPFLADRGAPRESRSAPTYS
jgi:hypothetical protein